MWRRQRQFITKENIADHYQEFELPHAHTHKDSLFRELDKKKLCFFLVFFESNRGDKRENVEKYDSIALVKVHWIAIQFHRFRMRLSYFTHRALIFTTGDLLSIHRANPFICVVSRCNTNMCTGVRLYSEHSISTHNSSRQSQNTDSAGFFPFKIGSCRTLV